MDRIRKVLQQIPIPVAFVLCGMAALLCALSLTRATMWFAQKNKGEIATGYAELAPIPSKGTVSAQFLTWTSQNQFCQKAQDFAIKRLRWIVHSAGSYRCSRN